MLARQLLNNKKSEIVFKYSLAHNYILPASESREQRVESREQRAESREHFAARILRISILLKKLIISENNPKRTTLCVLAFWTQEQRAESRERRAESREQRAESKEQKTVQ